MSLLSRSCRKLRIDLGGTLKAGLVGEAQLSRLNFTHLQRSAPQAIAPYFAATVQKLIFLASLKIFREASRLT